MSILLAVSVTMMLSFTGTASAGLLDGITSTVTKIVTPASSPVTVPTGVTQLLTGVNGLLTGAQSSLVTGQAVVNGFTATVNPSIASAITALQARAQQTAADAAALNTAGATADVQGAVSDLQAAATSEVGALTGVALTQALTNGLTIAQQVVSPVCSILGSPAALAGGLGVDLTRLYPLSTAIQPIDAAANNLLTSTYTQLYNQILSTVTTQLGPVGAVAGAVLTLLKYNWTTTYTKPDGTTVTHTTPALLDVPTPIDVDGSGSYDLCGTTALALDATSGQIKVVQQITKLPLAPAIMPVDVSGALLGVIGFGYQAHDSTAPINYTSSVAVPGANGALVSTDNTYTVFRGQTLTIPPLLNNFLPTALPLGLGNISLPNIPALLQPAPAPKLTQQITIGGSALALNFRYENEPGATHAEIGLTGGLKIGYTGSDNSDLFGFNTAVSSIGVGAQTSPVGTQFNSCAAGVLGGAGACSNESPADSSEAASLSFTSNRLTKFDEFQTLTGDGINCPTGTVSPALDAHLTGTQFAFGQAKSNGTAGPTTPGKIYVDSGGTPVSGCVSVGTPLTNGLLATLPPGFSATNRAVRFHETGIPLLTFAFVPDAKTGAVTCPTGTSFAAPSSNTTANILGPVAATTSVCNFPPANTAAPAISGQSLVDATLTSSTGTWTPPAPNSPTFTRQWLRCDAAGNNCAQIAGATGTTYFVAYGDGVSGSPNSDLGHTIKVAVTGTNLDGAATATSAQTAVVQLPPPPANTAKPVISSVTPPGAPVGVGRALKTTDGTWQNGVLTFSYDWLRCDATGASCVSIGAPNQNTYTPVLADEGHQISVTVGALNHSGPSQVFATATAPTGFFVPPPPMNTSVPFVGNGASNATGQPVLTADNLTARNGNWNFATGFAYQWLRCDGGGANCNPIGGATLSQYTVTSDDVGSTLRVTVTASNIDGATPLTSAATGVAAVNDLAVRPPVAVVDGSVKAIAASDHASAYLGGNFDTAGAPTGGAGQVTAAIAASGPVTNPAKTQGGPVRSVVADGTGGYFLAGSFNKVAGLPCNALAHITSTGALDATFCQPGLTGDVRAVDFANGIVAIGGTFLLGGHANLAFFDSTGAVIFAPSDTNGPINSITNDGGSKNFYVGGDFTTVGATVAMGLAKFNVGAGNVITQSGWAAGVDKCAEAVGTACTTHTASVKVVKFIGIANGNLPSIIVGGSFDRTIIGTTYTGRNNAAAFAASSAATLGGWNPNLNGAVNAIAVPILTPGLLSSATIYLGGDFTAQGANAFSHIVQFGITFLGASAGSGTSVTSGPSTTWKPAIDNGTVNAIAIDGTAATSNIYVGGTFTSVGGVVRHRVAAFKPAGAAVTAAEAWDPNAGRSVLALTRSNTTMVIGGSFNVLGGQTRNNLAEISPNTGLTGWNPNANGTVNALVTAGGGVIAGGSFSSVGGSPRSNLAAVDTSAGALSGWNPGADGPVNALAASGATVYAGGAFGNAGGSVRANVAAIDISTAGATGWNPGADGAVNALAVAGGNVYIGGSFGNAGGQPRANLAAVDTSGATQGWNPGTDGPVNAVAVDSGTVYVGGSFANAAGGPRSNAAAVDATTGVDIGWNPNADGTVRALLPFGSAVFIGGDFLNVGGAARTHAGQVANDDGNAKSFAPEPDGVARAFGITSGGSTVVGGDFGTIAGALSPGAGFFGGS